MNPTHLQYLVGAYVIGLGLLLGYGIALWAACGAKRRRRQSRGADQQAAGAMDTLTGSRQHSQLRGQP